MNNIQYKLFYSLHNKIYNMYFKPHSNIFPKDRVTKDVEVWLFINGYNERNSFIKTQLEINSELESL